jgi:hypothetical protein
MTDEKLEPDVENGEAPETTPEEAPQQPPAAEPVVPALPTMPPSRRSYGGTGIGRWASFGCLAVMIILVVVLLIGVGMTKRTAWIAVTRAERRVVEELPRALSSGERLRIERNLQRFRARLEVADDPFPLMGQFLDEIQTALADDELSTEEVTDLNLFLEGVFDQDLGEAVHRRPQ